MSRTDEGYWCSFGGSEKNMELVKEYVAKDPLLENL